MAEQDRARLEGQVVVITGGAQGIGLGIARAFGAAGCSLVLVDIDEARLGEAAADLRRAGVQVVPEPVDVGSVGDVRALFDRVRLGLGRLDVLVNNAGIIDTDPWPDIDPTMWSRVFRVNVEGAAWCTQAAVKIMRGQDSDPRTGCRGKINFIGSGAAEVATRESPAYGASKAALRHLCQDVVATHSAEDIAATIVNPRRNIDGMWRPGYMAALKAKVRGTTDVNGQVEVP